MHNCEFKISLRRYGGDNATNVAYLMNKNKTFTRPSRAFFKISVHAFVSCSRQICDVNSMTDFSSFTENVNTGVNLNFLP